MATVYSSNYSTGTYTYTRVRVDYSGTSATAILLYTRTNTYSGASGQLGTFTFGGQTVTYDKYFYGQQTDAEVARVSFTISAAGGTYSGSSVSSGSNHLLDFSGSVYIPAQGTAPSAGYISGLRSEYNPTNRLIEFSAAAVGVSSSTALTEAQFRIMLVPNTGSGLSYQAATFTNGGSVTLNQSNSIAGHGGITIVPNQLYYSGLYAANAIGSYYYNGPSIIAPAAPANCSVSKVSSTSVRVSYSVDADGGYYSRKIEYSLDNGANWITGDTAPSGSITGVFTVAGLNPHKNYIMLFRVRTPAGITDSGNVNFSLAQTGLYGSMNGQTKKVTKLYGSVSSQTKVVKKLYASVNGRAKLIYKEN